MVLSLVFCGLILTGLLIYFFDKRTKKIWAKLGKFEIGMKRESKKDPD